MNTLIAIMLNLVLVSQDVNSRTGKMSYDFFETTSEMETTQTETNVEREKETLRQEKDEVRYQQFRLENKIPKTVSKQKTSCDIPYVLDSAGNKIYNPNCLKIDRELGF
jgi:hypothetical protein